MNAAIYARKSTEQYGVADEQKSVARQIEHARQYAERKGWTIDEACVFVDDGISGAEFANRPGFLRLMNAVKPRAPFQVLVMSEESRLGREAIETAYALKQLVTAGVRVFFYLEDRERTLDSPTDKIMLSLTAFADELESKYLLTGMSRCGLCGGTMIVRSRSHGRQRAYFYACSSFHHRGKTVCPNSLDMRLEVAEDAILSALEQELLDPEILQAAAARAAVRVATPAEDIGGRRHALETALGHTEAALARLTQAIAVGGSVSTLVQAIRDQERRHQTLRADLADLDRPRVVPLNVAQLKARLLEKSEDWRALLRKHAPIARQIVRKLVDGRIVFTPDPEARRYRFTMPGTLTNFFSGIVCPLAMASPRGIFKSDAERRVGGPLRPAA
jgi:Resolvase, N terminal domain/Recombinase zinc beta ribbon domain